MEYKILANLRLKLYMRYRPGVPVRDVQQVGVGGGDAVVLHLIVTMAGVRTQPPPLYSPGS